MSTPPPSMPDSWHLDPPLHHGNINHAHKLSGSDPWGSGSGHSASNLPPVSGSGSSTIPTHYGLASQSHHLGSDPTGELAGLPRGGRKGKERERELPERDVMDVLRMAPVWLSVLGDMMDTSKGRDKILKCVQYSLKTYLYLLSLVVRIRPLSRGFLANRKRVTQAVGSLSLTRKCLILLTPLHPLSHLLSPSPTSAPAILRHLLDLASGVSDDLFTLSRLGLVNRKLGSAGDKWSNRLWFLSTLIALYKLHLQTLPRLRDNAFPISDPGSSMTTSGVKAREQLADAEWTNRKLLADLIFSSYDVFHLTWFVEPVKCFTGLAAGLISTTKLYDLHWRASLGKG